MGSREHIIAVLRCKPTAAAPSLQKANTIEVSVYHSKDSRAYYLSVSPYEVGNGMRTYVGFSGIRIKLEDTNRYSAKRLEALANEPRTLTLYKSMLAEVLSKNHLEIENA